VAGPIDNISRGIAPPISQLYCSHSPSCRTTANEKFWAFDALVQICCWAGFAMINSPTERCSRCSFPSTRWRSSFYVVSDFDTHVSPENSARSERGSQQGVPKRAIHTAILGTNRFAIPRLW